MGRFRLISRPLKGVQRIIGYHVGVQDTSVNGEILEYTTVDNAPQLRCVDMEDFLDGEAETADTINEKAASDPEIIKKWNEVTDLWNSGNLQKVPYHAEGKTKGISCETIAYYVFTGKIKTPQGDLLKSFSDIITLRSISKSKPIAVAEEKKLKKIK